MGGFNLNLFNEIFHSSGLQGPAVLPYTVIGVCFGVVLLVEAVILFRRRNIQPIKAKGPRMLILTMFGNYVLLFFVALVAWREWHPFPGMGSNSFCDVYKWAVTLFYPLTTLPFLLRYFRVRFIFSNIPSTLKDAHGLHHQENGTPVLKSSMREDHILRILLLIVLFAAFLKICFEELFTDLSEVVANSCENHGTLTGVMLFWVLVHTLELLLFLWTAFDDRYVVGVLREFSMANEMTALAVCWLICTGGATTCLVMRLKDTAPDTDDRWYWKFNTLCDLGYNLAAVTIGVTWPVIRSYTESGFSVFPLFGNCSQLRSLEGTLSQITSLQVFRSFLIQECTVENLLLWVEIELFKDNPVVRQGRRIYNKFLSEESELEVSTVSNNSKRKVRQRLSRKSEHINGEIRAVFDDVQSEVFDYLKRESYPRFLASSQSMLLMDILDREEFLCQALVKSGML